MAKGDSPSTPGLAQKSMSQLAPMSSTPNYSSGPSPDITPMYTGGNKIPNTGPFGPYNGQPIRPDLGPQLDNDMGPQRQTNDPNAPGFDHGVLGPMNPPQNLSNPWLIQAIQNGGNMAQPINANSNSATPQRIYQGDATARTMPPIMPNMNMFQNWINKMGLQGDPNQIKKYSSNV
jgi:hypothetical protein